MNIPEALVAFLQTSTWDETKRILEKQQQVLLSEQAIAFLRHMIDELRLQPDLVEGVPAMEAHLHLLEDARTMDMEQAWKKFMGRLFQAKCRSLASASNWASNPDLVQIFQFLYGQNRDWTSDLDLVQIYLFLYQQNPGELAKQMGFTKDDSLFLKVIEILRGRVGG